MAVESGLGGQEEQERRPLWITVEAQCRSETEHPLVILSSLQSPQPNSQL